MERLSLATVFLAAAIQACLVAEEARAQESRLPDSALQLVVAIAPEWRSWEGALQCYERRRADQPWRPAVFTRPITVLLGVRGMAWGRGVLPAPAKVPALKKEGDKRSPAGCFRLGTVFGAAERLPRGGDYRYRRVTGLDAWIDDVAHPLYNRHVVVDPDNVPSWFDAHRMRLDDSAHRWLVEVRHNADPPVPGAGSAIFLHVRHGPDLASSGCTTMKREDLERILRWLRTGGKPHYVLLPRRLYEIARDGWGLPEGFAPAGK